MHAPLSYTVIWPSSFLSPSVMDKTTETGMPADAVAEIILNSVVRHEPDVVIAPFVHRVAVVLRAVAPHIFFSIMAKRARKQRKDYVKTE